MKKIHAILFIVVCIVVGNIIYFYPKSNFSPVPTQWGVGSGWGRYYIIEHGRIPEKVHALTWQSGIKNYATVDVLPKILASIVNIVTGTTTFPDNERFHYIFPWCGILFLPLVVLYFYRYISRKEGEFSYMDCCLLYLFAMFPLAGTIFSMSQNLNNGSSVTRVFFLLLLISLTILFVEKKKDVRRLSIFLFLLSPFFYYYHTWAYYLAIYLTAIAFLTLFKKNERYIMSLLIFGIVVFFTSAMYYNYQLLEETGRIIRSFPQLLVNFPSVSYTMKVNPELLGYRSLKSMYSYLQLINSVLILSLCLVFFRKYLEFRKKGELKPYEKMLFYFLVAQFFVGCALFVWDGILGVYSRIFEALVYVAMLISAYLLVKSKGKLKFAIRSILLFAVLLCIVSYLTYPSELNRFLTHEEFKGVSFAGEHIPKESYIFSDFRLGTPLIYFDQLGIKTIESTHHPPEITEEILEKCYYNVTRPERILDKIINKPSYYVITSSQQSEIGILDPSLKIFKPASRDFQEKWAKELSFNEVYSSNCFRLYQRL